MIIIFEVIKLIIMQKSTPNQNKKSKLTLKKKIISSGSLHPVNSMDPTVIIFTMTSIF